MTVRRSLFWKVAPALVALQLVVVAVAAGFTIWYARSAQETLASAALAARIDATAEEIERRTNGLADGVDGLEEDLRLDLSFRFPDPLILIDLNGTAADPIWPSAEGFAIEFSSSDSSWDEPSWVQLEEAYDDVVIDLSDEDVEGGFASAPLFDAGGFPAGLLVVQPLTRSLDLELAASQEAFRKSVRAIAILAVVLALLFGGILTWWLVGPIRRMAAVVSEMGGDWQANRVEIEGEDEIAVLGRSINEMADRVAESIESLRATDRMRRELVANVGHDLRTPLAGIRLHIEEANRFESEGRHAEAVASLTTAQKQIDHVSRMIDDLFELSRLEGDASLLRIEPIPPAELVSEVVGMFAASASQAEVVLQADLDDDLPILHADGTRLIRLLGNLISNAIRHAPERSEVSLNVRANMVAGELTMSVSDQGVGMSEEDQQRLFDRYYRGSDARTRDTRHKRTGLGLAIAKAVAEAHDGRLEVESAPGEGTTMRFTLPIGGSPDSGAELQAQRL